MQLVTTLLGDVPESDLTSTLIEEDAGDVALVAREWLYKGEDPRHAEHVGKLVRRDVWATIKCGAQSKASSEL
jgi:hypothetical protein